MPYKFSNENEAILLLKDFIAGTLDHDICGGLCTLAKLHLLPNKDYTQWEHFSGDIHHPVWDKEEDGSPREQFINHVSQGNTLFIGKQLELRISLAKFLLEQAYAQTAINY